MFATPLRVVLNAQGVSPRGISGGVEQLVIGLVRALGQLDDGSESYQIMIGSEHPDWLNPYLGRNQQVITPALSTRHWSRSFRQRITWPVSRMLPQLRSWWQGRKSGRLKSRIQTLGADVMHYLHPDFLPCGIPTVYCPLDLQHRHFPQFFSPAVLSQRENVYSLGCRKADAIVSISQCVKNDIVRQYAVDPDKIYVVPLAPATQVYEPVDEALFPIVARQFGLPQRFALFPGQTWPHKNHLRLIDAIDRLRCRGLSVPVICTGFRNKFAATIMSRINELGLGSLVRFLDFVSPADLRCLYRMAEFVVFPSLFEGAGLPVLEAFHEGTPVACSNATSLPEYGGNAVFLFDPLSVESIANAVERMFKDNLLRQQLREAGSKRAKTFSWNDAGKQCRALYRMLAGRHLSQEDRDCLDRSRSGTFPSEVKAA